MGWEEIRFGSGDDQCVGRLFRPDAATGPLPCVVMGSGFSCVRDQGLDAFAERLAEAGFAALAFDYRHWGESEGEPRQLSTRARHRADWSAAVAHAAADEEIDSARIALWATRWEPATSRPWPRAASRSRRWSASRPLLNGRSSLLHIGGPRHMARLTGAGLRDAAGTPGSRSLPDPGDRDARLALGDQQPRHRRRFRRDHPGRARAGATRSAPASPSRLPTTWSGRSDGSVARPSTASSRPTTSTRPSSAGAPRAARRAASFANTRAATTRPSPRRVFDRLVDDQIEFLGRHLGAAARASRRPSRRGRRASPRP